MGSKEVAINISGNVTEDHILLISMATKRHIKSELAFTADLMIDNTRPPANWEINRYGFEILKYENVSRHLPESVLAGMSTFSMTLNLTNGLTVHQEKMCYTSTVYTTDWYIHDNILYVPKVMYYHVCDRKFLPSLTKDNDMCRMDIDITYLSSNKGDLVRYHYSIKDTNADVGYYRRMIKELRAMFVQGCEPYMVKTHHFTGSFDEFTKTVEENGYC